MTEKNKIAQINDIGINYNALGYAIKASSIPNKGNFSKGTCVTKLKCPINA